jgi:hypothetical protein
MAVAKQYVNRIKKLNDGAKKRIRQFLKVRTDAQLKKKMNTTDLNKAYKLGQTKFNKKVTENKERKKQYIVEFEFKLEMKNNHDGRLFESRYYMGQTITNKIDEKKDVEEEKIHMIEWLKNQYLADELKLQKKDASYNGKIHITNRIKKKINPLSDLESRMRDVKALDGYGEQQWNTKTKQCVVDYLRHTYEGKQGFKNKNGKFWLSDEAFSKVNKFASSRKGNILISLHGNKEDGEDVKGVDRNNIRENVMNEDITNWEFDGSFNMMSLYAWCVCCNIPHYALDSEQNIVYCLRYTHDKNVKQGKGVPPVIYQYKNNHFNPVTDPNKYLNICRMGNNSNKNNGVSSDSIEQKEKKGEDVEYENNYTEDLLDKLPQIITQQKRDLQNRSVKLIENTKGQTVLKSILFKEAKKRYVNMDDEMNKYKTYCDTYNLPFDGLSLSSIGNNQLGDIPKSHLNPLVYNWFNSKGIGDRAHLGCCVEEELFNKLFKSTDIKTADINKHYTAVFKQSYQEYAFIDFKNDFVQYNQQPIKAGYYVIETDDMTLFHGSNVYSHGIVKYGLQEKIIKKKNIKYVLECKRTLKQDYFKKFVNEIYKIYGKQCEYEGKNINLAKDIVNRTIGCLNKTKHTSFSNVGLTNNTDELLLKLKMDKRPFCKTIEIEGNDYHLYGNKNEVIETSNNRPLWVTVLDNANILLYKTAKEIGGTLLYRKTDALVISNPKQLKPSETIGGYKLEGLPKNMFDVNDNVKMQRKRDFQFFQENGINELNIFTSNEYEKILEHTKYNSLLLIGRAGTGKTYIAKKLIEDLNINVRLAFTNKACININGSTIHNFLKLKDGKICSHWANQIKANYIMVDEISMLNSNHWKLLCDLKIMTGAKFILLGDYRQCPPIEDDEEEQSKNNHTLTHFIYNTAINYLCDNNKIEFTEYNPNARYNKLLWDVSQQVFEGDESGIEHLYKKFDEKDLIDKTNICFLNSTRKTINHILNNHHKNDNSIYLKYDGEDDTPQNAYLYENIPIIFNKTIKEKKERIFMKNEQKKIDKLDDKYFYVDGYKFELNKFHDICLLGYGITIYKSQGDTIKGNINIFDWGHYYMNGNMKYTAITRGQALEDISIIENITMNTINNETLMSKEVFENSQLKYKMTYERYTGHTPKTNISEHNKIYKRTQTTKEEVPKNQKK